MQKLLVATRSLGKKREIRSLLGRLPYEIVFPEDVGLYETPEEQLIETEQTFEGNACKKAEYFQQRARIPTVADDSGIEVLSLGGLPGVRSRRFAMAVPGQDIDLANNNALLQRLAGAPADRRGARYRCVVVLIEDRGAVPLVFEGSCRGRIETEAKGTGGFGYDPLFYSHDLEKTFGEASQREKDGVSHRGEAFTALAEWLEAHPLSR